MRGDGLPEMPQLQSDEDRYILLLLLLEPGTRRSNQRYTLTSSKYDHGGNRGGFAPNGYNRRGLQQLYDVGCG